MLVGHGLTAVPVLDEQDRPVGVVSEADLLCDEAAGEGPGGSAPTARLSPDTQLERRAKDAAGLMTSPAACASPEWTVARAARVMGRRGVRRLVVVDEAGRLVGVVSRGDLLRGFLRRDGAIIEEIRREVMGRSLGLSRDALDVRVEEGEATLGGIVETKAWHPLWCACAGTSKGLSRSPINSDTAPMTPVRPRTSARTGSRRRSDDDAATERGLRLDQDGCVTGAGWSRGSELSGRRSRTADGPWSPGPG